MKKVKQVDLLILWEKPEQILKGSLPMIHIKNLLKKPDIRMWKNVSAAIYITIQSEYRTIARQ